MKVKFEFDSFEQFIELLRLVTAQSDIVERLNYTNVDSGILNPDWDNAPEYAKSWAVDANGNANWYDTTHIFAETDEKEWYIESSCDSIAYHEFDKNINLGDIDWKDTKQVKP